MQLKQINQFFPAVSKNYFVSEDGRFFLKNDDELTEIYAYKRGKKGYMAIYLKPEDMGPGKSYVVHRVVLQCFNPIENMDTLQVNHIDGNKQNNSVSNLEWCTCKENIHHAVANNLIAHQIGETNPYHKLTEKEVKEIIDLLLEKQLSGVEIAKRYNVHKCTISSIKHHRNWAYLTKDINFD